MGQGNARIYNLISIIFLILTLLVIIYVVVQMLQPPRPREVVVAQAVPTLIALPTVTPTFTPTDTPVPTNTPTITPTVTPSETPTETLTFVPSPTFTETFTPSATATITLTPSETPIASLTPSNTPPPTATFTLTITTTALPSATPPPTATPFPTATEPFTPPPLVDVPSPYPFGLRDGQPVFTANFANTAGCAWQGIGGQVFDINDVPLRGVTVLVTGAGGFEARVTSGSNTIYGVSGWEVRTGNLLTGDSFRVELLSPGGTPISPQIIVTFTLNDCARNLALLNFKQTRPL
jgi:hypothetical protein